ncbi:MAG: FkbM family methyltransferase [Planctomycetota bacterium]
MPSGLIRRIKRRLWGEKPVRPVTLRRPTERLGSDYGGWMAVTGQLDAQSVVYSAGIGMDTSFDEAVISQFGCHVLGIDPTPRAIEYIRTRRASGHLDDRFESLPVALGTEDGEATFTLPASEGQVSGSLDSEAPGLGEQKLHVEVRGLRSIAAERGHSRIDLLKLDIEGSEYPLIEAFCNDPFPVAQFMFEVHPQFYKDGRARTERALEGLIGIGYEVFWVSRLAMEYHLARPDLLR